jgi:hypothetical protein
MTDDNEKTPADTWIWLAIFLGVLLLFLATIGYAGLWIYRLSQGGLITK